MNKKEICPSLSVLFSQCCTEKKERLQLPAEPSRTQRDIRSIISGLHIHTQSHIHVYVTSSPKGMPKKTSAHLLIFVSPCPPHFFFSCSPSHTHTHTLTAIYLYLSPLKLMDGLALNEETISVIFPPFPLLLGCFSTATKPSLSPLLSLFFSLTPRFRFTCEINVSGVNMKSSGNDDSI